MNKLNVRVQPKSGVVTFYRCNMSFGKEFTEVTVDDATAQRLREEQMLEVVDVADTAADMTDLGAAERQAAVDAQEAAAKAARAEADALAAKAEADALAAQAAATAQTGSTDAPAAPTAPSAASNKAGKGPAKAAPAAATSAA